MTSSLRTLLFVFVALPASVFSQSSPEPLDAVVAVVNDGIVLQSELDREIAMISARLRATGTPAPPADVLRQQVLERLVVQQIQLQRAERTGIQISDEELNNALANLAERNGTTLTQLPAALEADGMDYGEFRQEIRKQMVMERLRSRDVMSRIAVSPREIANYLERSAKNRGQEYNFSHILIAIPSDGTPEDVAAAEKKVNDIFERAQNGEDFAKLAVSYSDGQQALEGGLIGWRSGSELPSLFAEMIPAMEVAQVSEPLRGGSGFHLIRLNEIRGQDKMMEEQSNIRHILIKTTEIKDSDTAKQQILEIRQQIVEEGEDFATVATAVSEDPGSAANGGELGWTNTQVFVPEFREVADTIEIGEVSEAFESPFGWHILEVLGRRDFDMTDDVRQREAIMAVRNAKLEEETELWVRRIRDEAFVEYRL